MSHETHGESIVISVESGNEESECPYCGALSKKVHSKYERKLQALPIQGKKVRLLLNRKKYFCTNKSCSHRTFAEGFDFFEGKATKTKRLQDTLTRMHPRTSTERINERARHAAARYAERQHRSRAASIARTELVASYNAGRHYAVG